MSVYRYRTLVAVRDNYGHERVCQANATARSELLARRQILERAWACGLCVSRFLAVEQRARPTEPGI